MSKTPKFDSALDAILDPLVPHERTCNECSLKFNIEQEDIAFLRMLRVPPPTLCPSCRLQRRISFRCSIRPIFHKKTCNAPEHSEQVISFYNEDNPVVVYDDDFYRSDNWDALTFGASYDPTKPFFKEFDDFSKKVPRSTLAKDPQSVNSDFVLTGKAAKNCYYVAVPYLSENLQYGFTGARSKDCIDFVNLDESEFCYRCAESMRLFNSRFCYSSYDCVDSAFLFDCRNCISCFGCTNLRNKKYCFFNEQLTKEEYERRVGEIDLGSYKTQQELQKRFNTLKKTAIHKNLEIQKSENVTGNQLYHCRDCVETFRVLFGGENLRYCAFLDKATDSMDFWGGVGVTLMYESTGCTDASGMRFSWVIRTGLDSEYCIECQDIKNCFGCVGLKKKSSASLMFSTVNQNTGRNLMKLKPRCSCVANMENSSPLP